MRVAPALVISGLAAACSPAPGAQRPPEPTPTASAAVAAASSAATDPSSSAAPIAGSTPTSAASVAATIDEARAIQIGLHHGMWVDQLSFPSGMRPKVTDSGTSYEVEWRPEPGQAGFIYRVRIDKRTGDVLSTKATER